MMIKYAWLERSDHGLRDSRWAVQLKKWRKVVSDPTCPPEELKAILGQIMARPSEPTAARTVVEGIAENPNVSLELLFELAPRFPRSFAANPVTPLLALERPDLIANMPEHVLTALLRLENLPGTFVAHLSLSATSPDIATDASQHVAIAGEIPLEQWDVAIRDFWKRNVEHVDRATRETYAEVARLDFLPEWAAGGEAPPDCTDLQDNKEADELIQAMRETWGHEYQTKIRLADDPLTPPEVLEEIAREGYWAACLTLIRNPAATPEILERIAQRSTGQDGIGSTRKPVLNRALARHPQSNAATLLILSSAGDETVLRLVARHPNATLEVHSRCARRMLTCTSHNASSDFSLGTFALALRSSYVPAYHNYQLSRNQSWGELLSLACAAPEPHRTISGLENDGNRLIRATARARRADPSLVFSW